MRNRWLIPLLVVVCAGTACHAQTGTITGIVYDAADRTPLPGAHVVMVELERGAIADADGRFRLAAVPAGTHRLRASFVGYDHQDRTVSVGEADIVEVIFELVLPRTPDAIVVTSDRLRTVGRTRAIPVLIPQAVTILDEAQLRAQDATDVEAALRNMSGVVLAGRQQPFGEFTLRGFPADGTGTFRRNGIEFPHLFDGLRANVVQVEVLKGPASVLYGRIEPGGVVNFVTRRPTCREDVDRVDASVGRFGGLSARATYEPACGGASPEFVVDASVERRESIRDRMSQESAFVSGVVRGHPFGGAIRLTLDTEYELAGADLDPGLALPGTDVPGTFDRDPFFGEPEAGYRWRNSFASAMAEHWPSAGQLLRSVTGRVAYGDFRHDRALVKIDSLTAGGMLARSLTSDDTRYRYLYGELSSDGEAVTGAVEHEFVIGLEGTRLAIDVTGEAPLRAVDGGFQFASIEPIALLDPQPTGLPGGGDVVEYVYATGSGLNLGLFAQNRARLATPIGDLHAVVSARFARVTAAAEWFALAATPDTPAGLNERSVTLTAVTPALALLLAPRPDLSLYGSYGTSFNPIFHHVDADGQPFEPTRGEQFELGIKVERGALRASVAAFDLRKRGALSRTGGFYIQTGAQRSRGVELDLAGSPVDRLSLLAAYTLMDAILTADEVIPAGNRLSSAPVHSGRLWGTYDVLPAGRLTVSLGVQFVGERFGTLENVLELPAYHLLDAAITLRPGRRLALQLTGENLLDEHYMVSAERRGHGSAQQQLVVGWPGPPRTIRLRLTATL